MRRMLDKKELEGLGGGGDSKTLYHHHVTIDYNSGSLVYEFEFDYYSFNGTESKNIEQLKEVIKGHTYACSGFRNSGNVSLAVTIGASENGYLNVHYLAMPAGTTENQQINDAFRVIDKAKPVA